MSRNVWSQMIFHCAFLNCHNLYLAGAHPVRGPRTEVELDRQIECLASTLQAACGGAPELIALSEVGDPSLGGRVAEALPERGYESVWSGVPPVIAGAPQTGLMALYDPSLFRRVGVPTGTGTPGLMERTKWLPLLLQLLSGSGGAFWLIVVQWKSQLGGQWKTEVARMDSAREIGEFYLNTASRMTDAMILLGDFNCEPGDRPFKDQGPNKMKAVRERALVMRERNRLAYLYNPMWRWLGEPDHHEIARQPGYRASRVIGTYASDWERGIGWSLWDQVPATKPLLSGELIRFIEGSVQITRPVGGCSDHCALSCEFEY